MHPLQSMQHIMTTCSIMNRYRPVFQSSVCECQPGQATDWADNSNKPCVQLDKYEQAKIKLCSGPDGRILPDIDI